MALIEKRFYMIRVKGGEWSPRRKISNLAKAMEVAYTMAEFHKQPTTILQSAMRVEVVEGKPVWEEVAPER